MKIRVAPLSSWQSDRCLLVLALALAASAVCAEPAKQTRQQEKLTAEMKHITQLMADAVAIGDKPVWDKYTDADLVYVDENNIVRDKQTLLKELEPLPQDFSGQIVITDYVTHFLPGAVVAVYILDETEIVEGHLLRNRYRETDTWIKRGATWKIAASQVLAINKDPPKIAASADVLDSYAGEYMLSAKTHVVIKRDGDHLVAARSDGKSRQMLMEAMDVFFTPDRPRERRIFVYEGGKVVAFRDRREGEDLVWKKL
jgi:hypothetical protein